MGLEIENISTEIRRDKHKLKSNGVDFKSAYEGMSVAIDEEISEIAGLRDVGKSVIPEIDFQAIVEGRVSDDEIALIKKRGCLIVKNTFFDQLAQSWSQAVKDYLADLDYLGQPDKGLDKYFSSLQKGKPQIFSVYWSKPQVEARQHENIAKVRKFINRLWDYEHDGVAVFDPDRECTYADRTRRREPGDNSLGLKPHIDGGSVERWLESSGYQAVFRHLLNGDWTSYDPYDARHRTETLEISSPAVCSMFRTWQGWTALSPQGPGDGTLQLIPSAKALGWMILRALQDDVPEDDLCGAEAARALSCNPEWHQRILAGLCSIPLMQPGDTVWWHPDVVHSVEDRHQGSDYSNVIYIGAAPYCEKNSRFLPSQQKTFLAGESAPDFAAENYEVDFEGRAKMSDLSELGKKQMGFESW